MFSHSDISEGLFHYFVLVGDGDDSKVVNQTDPCLLRTVILPPSLQLSPPPTHNHQIWICKSTLFSAYVFLGDTVNYQTSNSAICKCRD